MAVRITKSSGNVFADLGFPPLEAASLQVRARLMVEIIRTIRARKLTQAKAAKLFGISQPRVSNLMRGRIEKFSIDALVEMLTLAGLDVEVSVHGKRRVA